MKTKPSSYFKTRIIDFGVAMSYHILPTPKTSIPLPTMDPFRHCEAYRAMLFTLFKV